MSLMNKLRSNVSEESLDKLNEVLERLLVENEVIEVSLEQSLGEFILFTNKRLILTNTITLSGSGRNRAEEYRSLPYKNISSFSVTEAVTGNSKRELRIWTSSGTPSAVKDLSGGNINLDEVQRYLATKVL